jgi:mono/diheme cytochrome c family protein
VKTKATIVAIAAVFVVIALNVRMRGASQEENKGLQEEFSVIQALDGPTLFLDYCATCHGKDAKGNGPTVSALKKRPPDLTRISERNGGTFPSLRVEQAISGDAPGTVAHGSREMPVWGPIFGQIGWDRDLGKVRVHNLAKYIESLQKK